MLSDSGRDVEGAVVFDSGERAWARWRGVLGPVPVAVAGGLVLFDSSEGAWEGPVALTRKTDQEGGSSPERAAAAADDTVYFLSKSGDVVATNMQRSASRQYSSAVAYFLSRSGMVVACDLARRAFAKLPRILPVHHEYSIDVVACGRSI